MIKTTGAEWRAFMSDNVYWPSTAWYDDAVVYVDGEEWEDCDEGEEAIEPTAKVKVDGGCVYLDERGERSTSLAAFFRKWQVRQTHAFLSIACPKDRLDAVRAAIEAAGGEVL